MYFEIYVNVIVLFIFFLNCFLFGNKDDNENEWNYFYFLFDMEIIDEYMWKVF